MSTKRFCDVCGKEVTDAEQSECLTVTGICILETEYDICHSCIGNNYKVVSLLELIVEAKQEKQ